MNVFEIDNTSKVDDSSCDLNPFALSRLLNPDQLVSWANQAEEWDRNNTFAGDAIVELASTGLLGATFAREDGGRNASLRQILEAIRSVSHHAGVLGRVVVDSNLGPVGMVATYGSAKTRAEVAKAALRGDKPAIAITEPNAGSAASDLTTNVSRDNIGRLILNGQKCWITGAPESSIYVVFARFGEVKGAQGIGLVIARKGRPGISFGPVPRMMGMRGLPEGSVFFNDYILEDEDVLLEPGEGFKRGLEIYNSQRLGAAMVACGIAERAITLAVDYAKQRTQFGRLIGDNQGMRWMLCDMVIDVELALNYLRRVADDADQLGNKFTPDATTTAIAKIRCAEMAVRVTNAAIQVFGAKGYDTAEPLERLYRDARMFTIAGGTTEMLRNLVGKAVIGNM